MSLANLIKKGSLRGFATATPATFATHDPYSPPTVATVATVAVATDPKQAANDSEPHPDRLCWPASDARNTAEIDTFTIRSSRFTEKGLSADDAEALADRLVIRDREQDDRRLCLECAYLGRNWRCGNWQAAGVAIRSSDVTLPTDLVTMLQRCDGFAAT